MPATSFTFYGLVEQTEDPTGDFQFSDGQQIAAHLALSAAAAGQYEDIFEDEASMELTSNVGVQINFEGRNMFFPEELVIRSNGTDLSIVEMSFIGIHLDNDETQAPGSLFFRVNQFGDGGAEIIEEEGNGDDVGFEYGRAWIAGAWIPDDVAPNLVYGSAAGETLVTQGEVSMLWGMEGDDTLWGSSQSFYGWGGEGNDSLRGSREEDQLFGGLGDDFITGGRGADHLNGLDGADTVMGGEGEDTMSGGHGDDSLSGGKEDDRLEGSRGNDTLHGNSGDDTLFGGGESGDSLEGGSGADLLQGAHLLGGSGEDVFRFFVEFNPTIVYDFQNGTDQLLAVGVPVGVDVLSLASQIGADVQFDYDGLTFLTLKNVLLSQLDDGDFVG
jgi:Ca2+-binding RTX toxin-like protein